MINYCSKLLLSAKTFFSTQNKGWIPRSVFSPFSYLSSIKPNVISPQKQQNLQECIREDRGQVMKWTHKVGHNTYCSYNIEWLVRKVSDVHPAQHLKGRKRHIQPWWLWGWYQSCMCARSDDTRDDASDAMLHPPRMNRHRSICSSENE